MKKSRRVSPDQQLATYFLQFTGLKQQIFNVQYFCKGTVLKRMMKCGQRRCACHTDPAKRHGPYFEWTYKAKGKTVNLRLRPEEATIYETATTHYRTLKSALMRMEVLSRKAVTVLAKQACLGKVK